MDEFRAKFIELKDKFCQKDSSENVLQMFEFADILEQSQDQKAKRVLVDVYENLGFKQKAYDLFKQIADMTDKKELKKLGYLKDSSSSYGDRFAYKRPCRSKDFGEETLDIPHFRYHPDPFKTGVFEMLEAALVCECCGKATKINHTAGMYAVENVGCLCPSCIADGSAARKFDGDFVQDAEDVSDEKKRRELFKQTPGYFSWQGEWWLACCDDYCEFLGDVGTAELEELGIADEVFAEYEARGDGYKNARQYLVARGSLAGYLFRCLHCGRYKIQVDAF